MRLNEIDRLAAADYSGGKNYLKYQRREPNSKLLPVPGGSRFKYYTTTQGGFSDLNIVLVDPNVEMDPPNPKDFYRYQDQNRAEAAYAANRGRGDRVIGKLSLDKVNNFPLPNTYMVSTITLAEEYRGQGLALALYGIVLASMKVPLLSGDAQTPSGRKAWMNLATIPGCDVEGWARFPEHLFKGDNANKVIQRVINVGANYVGEFVKFNRTNYVFTFPVKLGKGELINAIKGSDIKVYDGDFLGDTETGLLARWTGK
jgi:hypothetical protein